MSIDPNELEQQFAPEGAELGEGGEPPAEPQPPPSPPEVEPEPEGPRLIQVGNMNVPEEDLVSLLEFQSWARSNPEKMDAFGRYLRGEAQFMVPEQPKAPQVDWDMVDPNIKNAYDEQQKRLDELQNRLQSFEGPLEAMQQEQINRVRSEAQVAIDAATGKMMDRFKLSDDEIDQLADAAAKLNIVPSLRAQGMAPQAALETALETAFWSDEKWRSRVVDEELAARGAEGRKARASQVGGTHAGAGAGLDSSPTTDAEKRTAMAAEIAEALRGTP